MSPASLPQCSAFDVQRSAFGGEAAPGTAPIAASGRFEVGCEGELIHDFPTAAAALRFAEWSADVTGCPHEILDAQTRTALVIVEPRAA